MPPLACGLAPIRRSPLRGEFRQFGDQAAVVVEQFLRFVAAHPALEQRHVFRMLRIHEHGHLMGAKGPLDLQSIDELRSRPALGRSQDDHRPSRAGRVVLVACRRLDPLDLLDRRIHGRGHALMHGVRIVAFDEPRRPAAAAQELLQFLALDARKHRGIADLVAIQVQDRQHGAVGDGIQELVGLPRGRQGAGFRLAVADDAGDDQARDCRRRRQTRGSGSTRVRRLRESTPAWSARRGSICRPETRIA